jgi:hypothetical protein
MSWADYMRRCVGYQKNRVEQLRDLRMVCAFISGKPPKQLWPLPGDWDNVPLRTPEERLELAKKFGVAEKWGLIN